jgi:predicted MFS family arabinose efflux permease
MRREKKRKIADIKKGNSRSFKYKLIISSVILFILAVGFNTLFTLTSLEKLYVETNVSEYRVIAKDLQRNIQNGLFYGKTFLNFYGIEKLLVTEKRKLLKKVTRGDHGLVTPEKQLQDDDIEISIANENGVIIYSDHNHRIGKKLPESLLPYKTENSQENEKSQSKSPDFTKYNSSYFTTLPIKDHDDQHVGIISISFNEKQIKDFLENIFTTNSLTIILISVISITALVFLLAMLPMDARRFSKLKISFIVFFIICSAQVLSSGFMTYIFKDHFIEISKDNSEALTNIVKRDIEYLLNNGIHIDHLVKMDSYLRRIIITTSELNDITIYDRNSHPLYRATKTSKTDFQKSKNAYTQWLEATKPLSNTEYNAKAELFSTDQYVGYISTNTSRSILFKKVIDIAMDSLTVLVISILFSVEMLILIFKYMERQAQISENKASRHIIHYGVMRPVAFLFLFGIDISISFIPLHMQNLYLPFLGLSRDTIMGLPISAEFLFAGIGILIAGGWLDRRGWHEPFIGGLLMASLGFVYSGLAPNVLHFIVSRGLVGLGYGLGLMAAQAFVITYSDNKTKTQGLANLLAGVFAGGICGGAAGAMLAEMVGFKMTFLFGSFILLSVIAYTIFSMRNAMQKPKPRSVADPKSPNQSAQASSSGFANVTNFLSNRIVLSLIFFSGLPAAIAVVGFMNYFIPVHLSRIGVSQSTIGQVQMIYGICLIYIGPLISRYVDASQDKKRYVFLGLVLGSCSFLIFVVLDGVASAAVAVFILGLSSSFVLASQIVYALKLKVTQELGEGKAIGLFRSTSRIGQMLGPVIFATLFAATNIDQGITYFGLFYLFTAFIFILLTQRDKDKIILEDG